MVDTSAKWAPGQLCDGVGGFSDIRVDAPVTIKDEAGKILATTKLASGHAATTQICDFTFSANVEDAKFYQVEVSHRGAVTYSKDDLDRAGWKIATTLGL